MHEPSADPAYVRAPGAAGAEVDGETVVLSPVDLTYHGLNAPAAAIWEILEEPQTLAALVDALLERFQVDRAVCESDTAECIAHLREIGVVHEQGSGA